MSYHNRRQPAWMSAPASEGRIRFIQNLLDERDVPALLAQRWNGHIADGTMTTKMAIDGIEYLKAQPRKDAPAVELVTEPGFYLLDGNVYQVKESKSSGRLYSQLVTAHGFDYQAGKGAFRSLRAEMAMTIDQVRAYGVATGICCNCSAALSDPISVEIGLGTSCGPNLMGRPAYNEAKKVAKAVPAVAAALAAIKERKAAEAAREEVAVG